MLEPIDLGSGLTARLDGDDLGVHTFVAESLRDPHQGSAGSESRHEDCHLAVELSQNLACRAVVVGDHVVAILVLVDVVVIPGMLRNELLCTEDMTVGVVLAGEYQIGTQIPQHLAALQGLVLEHE